MSSHCAEWKKWFDSHRKEIIDGYFSFLRFRSISADSAFSKESIACAEYLLHFLQKIGMKSELIPTSYLPLVYAEDLSAGKDKPTILLYGHYDVQPVDPVHLWKSDPFEPRLEGKEVYARGAQDNKGQIFYVLNALKALLQVKGKLPVNIKVCIEGEEESASKGLSGVLPKIKDKLKADAILVSDCDIPAPQTPAVVMGLRGLAALEVTLTGSKIDLHSGLYGGIAFNPNKALVLLLSKLWDKEGKVAIPHFYDDVQEMSKEEKKGYRFTSDLEEYRKVWGIEAFGNEKGYTPLESSWIRPTLEINGIGGGYFGEGFKTVIPAKATAKISCRLVPNQDPHKIMKAIKEFLKEHVQKGMKIEMHDFGCEAPVCGSSTSPLCKATMAAFEEVFGKSCQKILGGGSVPIIGGMVKALGADPVMMGTGLDTDAIHAPNEHFGLDRMEQGFLIVARTLELLGEKRYD